MQVFFSYSHEDEELRDELAKQLSILKHQKVITSWHDRRIRPGEEWSRKIAENLETAELILLLVSTDFLASDYIRNVELPHALSRHQENTARVVPIILRNCLWKQSEFAQLQVLPTDGHPIISDQWHNRDEAWLDVAEGILRIVREHSEYIKDKPKPPQFIRNVPYRQNHYSTGRKTLLEKLHKSMATICRKMGHFTVRQD